MAINRAITLDEFLTQKQIQAAWEIYEQVIEPRYAGENFAQRCDKEIIRPNLATIELKLAQQCDSRYLAYMVEHVFHQASTNTKKENG